MIFLLGTMVLSKDTCMTYLGPCADTDPCDANCCREKCLEQFKDKKPNPFCEESIAGDPRYCNCYHTCP